MLLVLMKPAEGLEVRKRVYEVECGVRVLGGVEC